jgi:hypothetical protein
MTQTQANKWNTLLTSMLLFVLTIIGLMMGWFMNDFATWKDHIREDLQLMGKSQTEVDNRQDKKIDENSKDIIILKTKSGI